MSNKSNRKLKPKSLHKVSKRLNTKILRNHRIILEAQGLLSDRYAHETPKVAIFAVTVFDHRLTLEECDKEFAHWQKNPTAELIQIHAERENRLTKKFVEDLIGEQKVYVFPNPWRFDAKPRYYFKEFISDDVLQAYLLNPWHLQPNILLSHADMIITYDGD